MKFYVFEQAFGVMAETEEDARAAAREQWGEHFVGSFESATDGKILMVVEANTIVEFFC